jgi:sigma-B regulation protein RsbU (phosphoserine phosphatase)
MKGMRIHFPTMKQHSLKIRFAATIALVYIIIGVVTYLAFHLVTGNVVRSLGRSFAVKQALLEKSKLISAIQRDLSLSLKLASSPLLRRWALDEDNRELAQLAREELESFRTSFKAKSVFFAIDRSDHYFFGDGTQKNSFDRPRYTLDPDNVNDSWYYRTMRDVDGFELNVDYDSHLDVTKVWFNVIVKDSANRKIGLGGSGVDISSFVNEIVNSGEQGVETILIGPDGAITGHRDKQYVIRNGKVRGTEKKITVYDLLSDDADKGSLKNAITSLSSGTREVETFFLTVEGKRRLAAMSHLKDINWYNLVLVDTAGVISNRDFLPILVITIISLLAVIVIIGYKLNRIVLVPLSRLAESSHEIARGNFDITMQVNSDDEIGALTRSFNDMARMVKDYTDNLEHKVNERTEALNCSNRMLAESNRKVMDSIRYAQLIQASILPEEDAIRRRMGDFFAIYRPRDIVGGDFYYFRESGENFIIAVIDCTGHGVPGAFMAMTAKAVLDHVLDTIVHDDPATILKELNRLMRAALHHDAGAASVDNGLEIGLCWCAPVQRKLVFAGARMDLHHVSRGKPEKIPGDRQPIGYRSSDTAFTYTNHAVTLEEGMAFYLASDGILDQAGGPRGWGFGRRRFNELLVAITPLPAADHKTAVEQTLARYQWDYPQRDDITVIGFRPLPTGGT